MLSSRAVGGARTHDREAFGTATGTRPFAITEITRDRPLVDMIAKDF
jgi:hypothetical protein